MSKREIFVSTLITFISLAVAFAAGYFLNQFLHPPELELPVLSEAQSLIEDYAYFPTPDGSTLEYGMIHGMVSALDDPYASFVEPVQHELETDTFDGEFGGVGSQITMNEEGQYLLYPFPDSPASNAGIENGDILLAVDSQSIVDEPDINVVVSMIRGPEGKKVSLTVVRPPDMEEFTYEIKRENFPIPSVTWRPLEQDPSIGLIEVNLIASSTAEEITNAIEDLKSSQVEYFILDLQNNGGGVLDSGIDIARLFLSDGDILYEQQLSKDIKTYKVNEKGPYTDIPLVVLINQFSASASEIIAGAIQAHDRAPLIGTPSYGKNTIQLVFTLQDESSIHITNAIWWVPGGSAEDNFQLIPDIASEEENPSREQVIQIAVDYFQNDY
ncbi:MAG: S41 family peptidase [Anaerolineales bacterium]